MVFCIVTLIQKILCDIILNYIFWLNIMKIKLLGNNELVSYVGVSKIDAGLDILIRTPERWIEFHRSGSSSKYISTIDDSNHEIRHDCVVLSKLDDNGETIAELDIVFIPENIKEVNLLNAPAFFSQDKDQIVILKIEVNHLKSREMLAVADAITLESEKFNSQSKKPGF